MILLKTPAFIKASKLLIKKNPIIANGFRETLNKLSENPFNPQLRTHKLKGTLIGSYACSINYELRIIFQIVKEEDYDSKKIISKILLEAVGTHDEVY